VKKVGTHVIFIDRWPLKIPVAAEEKLDGNDHQLENS
jgi:hypothetical protein